MERDPDFAAEVVAAENDALDELEESAHKHAKNDGRLALRILERKRNKTWGKTQQINHAGQIGLNVTAVSATRQELLNDPDYIEFLRSRAIEGDSQPRAICSNGEQGQVADGAAPCLGGP